MNAASMLDRVDARELGSRLKAARTGAEVTQEVAAQCIGAARTTIVAIERGDRRLSRPLEPDYPPPRRIQRAQVPEQAELARMPRLGRIETFTGCRRPVQPGISPFSPPSRRSV
jgi:DNA-binding XRE family transcriptional regulator